MRSFLTRLSPSLILAVLCWSSVLQAGAPKKPQAPEVIKLKKDTFEQFVHENGLAMIKFFAPWCGHCVKMADSYKKAAETLASEKIAAAVGEVDCTEEQELCKQHGITGYPSLKVFGAERMDKPYDYMGARDTESIVEYLRRMSLPPVQVIKPAELSNYVQQYKNSLIIATTMPTKHDAWTVFEKVAEEMRQDYSFLRIEGSAAEPSISVYKNFDEGESKYPGSLSTLTEKDLIEWVSRESIPLMADINQGNYQKYRDSNKPLAFLFWDTEEQKQKYGAIIQKVMKPFKGLIHAVYINAKSSKLYARELNLEPSWPGFVIHSQEDNMKYPYTSKARPDIDEAGLSAFVKSFIEGKIAPSFKSEPIPKENNGPLKTVVCDNFESIVLDKSKDVFVKIYMPECRGCTYIEKDWKKLAQAYAPHSDKIVIAEMHGRENDLPKSAKHTLEQFPTLLLYKANSNEKVEMKELGKLADFHKFLQENAVNKPTVDIDHLVDAGESKSAAASPEDSSASASASAESASTTAEESIMHEDL